VLLYEPNATPLDLRFRLFGTTSASTRPVLAGGRRFWAGAGAVIRCCPATDWATSRCGCCAPSCRCCCTSLATSGWDESSAVRATSSCTPWAGLAIGSNDVPHRWQRILVSAAGPAIQLLLFCILAAVTIAYVISWPALQGQGGMGKALAALRSNEALVRMLLMLLMIQLFWPLLNLFPIWPLDGGMIRPRGLPDHIAASRTWSCRCGFRCWSLACSPPTPC